MIERQQLLARALVVRIEDQEVAVLLAQQIGATHTFLPGGHVDRGEGLVQALRREFREELGVDVRVGRYLGAVEHQWPTEDPKHYEVSHVFAVEPTDPLDEPTSRESHLRFFWCPITALGEHNLLAEPLTYLIPAYVSGDPAIWWASTLPDSS
jgi:8-oxo-dGTP pyrophosphatase MutT (NUDIX family)